VPELTDLPNLANDVRERVVAPPYAEVSRRVRARRLRGAAGSLAAAVLVVGGVAVWQNAVTTAGPPIPQPAEETPIPPTDESLWRSVVDGTDAHPFEVAGTDDGSIAVLWRALEQPAPTFALVIREADGTVHGRRLDEPVQLTPVPGGWVGVRTARAWFIGSDGTWTDLGTPGEPRPPRGGDVVIHGQYGRWLYYPGDRTWQALGDDYGDFEGAYVTPDGVPVTCDGNGRGQVTVVDDGDLDPSVQGETCVMAGRGDDVVVAGLGDDPSGEIRLTGLLLKSGETWTAPHIQNTPVDDVVSLVVIPDGRALVTDSDGDAVIFGGDGSIIEVGPEMGPAFVAGDQIYLQSYAQAKGPLVVLADDLSWQETPLPGLP
jgi:hypothetical protein